jgi:RNA polymerase sigma factor (sigma-70 family)
MASAREEFGTLYQQHAPAVFRRARGLLKSDAEAHEVVQDLFLSLYERPEQFAAKSTMTTWLYSATTHACLNRLRNQRNRLRLLDAHGTVVEPAAKPKPDALSALRNELERMPEPLGAVAVYYYFDELTHEEIAALLGCSRRQVGNHLERLQDWLAARESKP